MEQYEKMDKYLKSSITAPSATNGEMTAFEKRESLALAARHCCDISFQCWKPGRSWRELLQQSPGSETGTAEMETARCIWSYQDKLSAARSVLHCAVVWIYSGAYSSSSFELFLWGSLFLRGLSICRNQFGAMAPSEPVVSPHHSWFVHADHPILRCLRTRRYYYTDIKCKQFFGANTCG